MGGKLLAAFAGLSILAGCGTSPVMTSPVQPAETLTIQHGGTMRMLKGLELTDEQKNQIKTIVRSAICERDTDTAEATALKTEILATEIDKEKLAAAIQAKGADREAKIDKRVAMLTAIRNVLTPEQLAKLVEGKETKSEALSIQRHGKHSGWIDRLATKIGMTDEQKANFQAVMDAFKASRKETRAARKQALVDFMKTGDAAALKTSLLALQTEMPVEAMVTAVSSLDQAQRQKLVDLMESHKAKMRARLCGETEAKADEKVEPKPETVEDKGVAMDAPKPDATLKVSAFSILNAEADDDDDGGY